MLGAAVILVAVAFVGFAFRDRSGDPAKGYLVHLEVDNAVGLSPGSEVRMAGVPVGEVTRLALDPVSFFAKIQLDVNKGIELPTDSSARVLADGLVGSAYVELEPGGDLELLEDGDEIIYSQGSINIVDLLARVIMGRDKAKDAAE